MSANSPPEGAGSGSEALDDALGMLGHVLGNRLTSIALLADKLEAGKEIPPDSDTWKHVRSDRTALLGTDDRRGAIEELLDQYGDVLKACHGLEQCLLNMRDALRNFQWDLAVREYRAAKQRFGF